MDEAMVQEEVVEDMAKFMKGDVKKDDEMDES